MPVGLFVLGIAIGFAWSGSGALVALYLGVSLLIGLGACALFFVGRRAVSRGESPAAIDQSFRDGIESMVDGFLMFAADKRVIHWNQRYVEIFPHLQGKLRWGLSCDDVMSLHAHSSLYAIPVAERPDWVAIAVKHQWAETAPEVLRRLRDGRTIQGSFRRTRNGGLIVIVRDVTAEAAATTALAQSEQRFRDFAASTADWFWELDAELRFSFLSDTSAAINGVAPERLYGLKPMDFRPPGVTDEAWAEHLATLNAHLPYKDFRFESLGGDGARRTVSVSGKPVFDAAGAFLGYRGIGADITPLVETLRTLERTKSLAESNARLLRDGIESMQDAYVMLDAEGRVVLWNSQYVALFPHLRDLLREGLAIHDLAMAHATSPLYGIPVAEREAWVEKAVVQMMRQDQPTLRRELPNGRVLQARISATSTGGVIHIIRDVTSELRALGDLRDSQETVRRLALVAQHTDNSVIITDAAGRIEWTNPGFTRVSGYTPEEVIGRNPGALLQGRDTDPETVAVMRAAIQRRERFHVEILNYGKSGQPYWLEIDCAPVKDEHGDIERFVAIEADVTQRKLQEKRLAEALEREREVVTQQKRFVSIAAHEFRTPLTIIDGAAQRLLRTAEQVRPEDLRERVQKIRAAVTRMSLLVDTTLNMARIDEGRIDLSPTSVDIPSLLAAVCRRQEGISPDFTFAIASSAASVVVQADPRLLDQIFTNLLSNAIKYSGSSRRIEMRVAQGPERVEIAMRDFGIGVPADELSLLFTRFYRASTARGLPGTGIGLNLVKELVQLHGGEISVASHVGEGTTFTVILPIDVAHSRIATLSPAAA